MPSKKQSQQQGTDVLAQLAGLLAQLQGAQEQEPQEQEEPQEQKSGTRQVRPENRDALPTAGKQVGAAFLIGERLGRKVSIEVTIGQKKLRTRQDFAQFIGDNAKHLERRS